MKIELNCRVESLVKRYKKANESDFVNGVLKQALKNDLYNDKCYLHLRLSKSIVNKLDFLSEQLGLNYTKLLLLAVDELYLEYQKDQGGTPCS
jgi:hypothetical protein